MLNHFASMAMPRSRILISMPVISSFLVALMAEHHGGGDERGDDEVEDVTIRGRVGFVKVSEAWVLRSIWPQPVIHV
jgi:hypothetical protein